MTDLERYEVKAEAFRICTGHMAPGKDPASASYPAPFEERAAAWDKWHEAHALPIAAMLTAFDRIMNGNLSFLHGNPTKELEGKLADCIHDCETLARYIRPSAPKYVRDIADNWRGDEEKP